MHVADTSQSQLRSEFLEEVQELRGTRASGSGIVVTSHEVPLPIDVSLPPTEEVDNPIFLTRGISRKGREGGEGREELDVDMYQGEGYDQIVEEGLC